MTGGTKNAIHTGLGQIYDVVARRNSRRGWTLEERAIRHLHAKITPLNSSGIARRL
jgi:hypothetical protein